MPHKHPLVLQFSSKRLSCGICQVTRRRGFVYTCSPCNLAIHIECASVPLALELNHPFHHDHPLLLIEDSYEGYSCDFCGSHGKNFLYHCSCCRLNFHIKCAWFTFNIAEKNLKELEHVALQDRLNSTKSEDEELEDASKCFGCWEPLANYTSLDCGFNLHKKCTELPLKLNHISHRKHPLVLQFNSERLSCKICQIPQRRGFVYCCSPCKFMVQIECVLPSPGLVVEYKCHQHPFTLFPRQASFTCDAWGMEGFYTAYICCRCNIMVHKRCTSFPLIIKSKWHDHRIFHKYLLPDDFKSSDCICHGEVNPEHVSYCCSHCDVTIHARCVTEDKDSYSVVSPGDDDEIPYESSITILETNDAEEATKVKHFKHIHDLLLGPFVGGYGNNCGGCMLPISDPFYYCSQCEFFLHKACAELPKMKDVWHHSCRDSLTLISDKGFKCEKCDHLSNAFAYECGECDKTTCLRCVIALTPGARTSSKDEHLLFFYRENKEKCNACGATTVDGAFRCKDCNFVVDHRCFSLPITARHKCDEHSLSLTYHDDNNYSESHFCDICEGGRDPNPWFYHCATCDTSAHVKCVLGEFPCIKLGSIVKIIEEEEEEEGGNEHPLTFVKKIYYYPDCSECGKPCVDLSLECTQSGCNFIVCGECLL